MTGKTLKELNVQVGDVVSQPNWAGDTTTYYVMKDNHPYRDNSLWLCKDNGGNHLKYGWSSGTNNCTLISRAKKYTAWQFTPAPENAETHAMPDGAIAWRAEVKPVVEEVTEMLLWGNSDCYLVKFNTIEGKMELLT